MKSRIKNTYTNPQVVSIIFDEDTTFIVPNIILLQTLKDTILSLKKPN